MAEPGGAGVTGVGRTRTLVVVRHASAGKRATWAGADEDRPLDDKGRRQAESLAAVLGSLAVQRAYSAPVVRCLETIAPFVSATGLEVRHEPLLAEAGAARDAGGAVETVLAIAARPETALVCTQRRTLSAVLPEVFRRLGRPEQDAPRLRKAGVVVLHLSLDDGRLVSVERLQRSA
jgi:8-oxo-dGTP diphosphatase